MMMNVVSRYAPKVGCEIEEGQKILERVVEVVESIPREERLVIGADFNEYFCERNMKGQMEVDFEKK